MAFSGTLVTAGYVGAQTRLNLGLPLLGKAVWSEVLIGPATTGQAAPEAAPASDPAFTITSSFDVYISIGPAPNASTGPRYLVRAAVEKTFYCSPGDKVAVAAA